MFEQREIRLGEKVIFWYGSVPFIAFITDPAFEVDGEVKQSLTVFPPNAQPFTTVASYDTHGRSGTWQWQL